MAHAQDTALLGKQHQAVKEGEVHDRHTAGSPREPVVELKVVPAESPTGELRQKRAGGGSKKVAILNDVDSAVLVWRVAMTSHEPTTREKESLDPVWSQGLFCAKAEGHKGLASFYEWVAGSEHAERLPAIRAALAGAHEAVEPDDDGDESAPSSYTRNDLGNARQLVARFGDRIRFHVHWKQWLAWDGKRWKLDDHRTRITRFAKQTIDRMLKEAAKLDDEDREVAVKFAIKSGSRNGIENMMKLAETGRGIPIGSAELDADDYLFNCANGTLDLRTGALRAHSKADLITKLSPIAYDPSLPCPLWDSFLELFMAGDTEMIGYLKRAAGYTLTGDTKEQCFFFLHGAGENGKSTFLYALERIMGDYGVNVDPGLFTSKEMEGHSTEICDLDGPRCYITAECEERQKLAEAFLKRVTGGTDKLRARRMRADPYEFKPRGKLWMAGNSEPTIRGTDRGIWRRVRKVPFVVTIDEKQKNEEFPKLLNAEMPGILAWAVRGCLDWQAHKLRTPEAVREATETYRADSDTIAQYLEQRCLRVEGSVLKTETRDAFEDYKRWCAEEGITHPLTKNAFGRALTAKGIKKGPPSNGKQYYLGIELIDHAAKAI